MSCLATGGSIDPGEVDFRLVIVQSGERWLDATGTGVLRSWETAFPQDPTAGLCPGLYGGPWGGGGISYERGTPAERPMEKLLAATIILSEEVGCRNDCLEGKHGTYKTFTARFWTWRLGQSP